MEDPKLETFCLDNVPENSFLLLRLDVPGPMEKYVAANGLLKELEKYKPIFEEKKITLMLMTPKEDLSILTEKEMAQIGWIRRERVLMYAGMDSNS